MKRSDALAAEYDLAPLLAAIDCRTARAEPVRVALDGPCASGKSTVGQALAQRYGCPLLHMDDFFLRPDMRTPRRLSQPGGNGDYERFQREVLSPLCQGEPVCYRPWDCHTGSFRPTQWIQPSALTVVEGVYSLRPDQREAFHVRVWVQASWETRKARLLARCGPVGLARFEAMWSPLEEAYFAACKVRICCHLEVSTD
jgi:uridine kinase